MGNLSCFDFFMQTRFLKVGYLRREEGNHLEGCRRPPGIKFYLLQIIMIR